MNFSQLSEILKQTNERLYQKAVKAINVSLTMRNWLFGFYIVEFEQNGEDRAKYGKKLLQNLAAELSIKGLSAPELSRCRQFYQTYPEILRLATQKSLASIFGDFLPPQFLKGNQLPILGTPSQELNKTHYTNILGMPSQESEIGLQNTDSQYSSNLITQVSYSHFIELLKIEDPTKRRFYELIILKNQPSVTELRRLIHSLTFERFGLSGNKDLAFEQLQQKIVPASSTDLVKSHYFFEFLKINQPQLVEETELEQALITHLQDFIIELGNGFCFEARQKRILIDDEYFFIDLVFYHRLLKCHVLIELKTEKAKYEHFGQLKVYLQHYKKKEMALDDNPPVGILLVTDKNKTLVEYAIADSDLEIFVSKYQLQLPDKKQLERFIQQELKKM